MKRSRLTAICAAAVIAIAISGCTAGRSDRVGGAHPNFSGPWASLLTQEYRSTKSEVVRKILVKGYVSDRDFAEVSERYLRCMSSKGFPTTIDSRFDTETIQNGSHSPQEGLAVMKSCSTEMTPISFVRTQMLRNPRALPENDIIAACLVKMKVVSPSYTGKDYWRELESRTPSFDMDSAAAMNCRIDPLGLVGATRNH